MFSTAWRLVLMICLMPFVIVPFLNFVAIPLEIYLVVSLAAVVWRRNARPAQTE